MPTLPLFDPTAHPDGWHDVRSPGGYEWWYFDAEDASSDSQVVVILMQGFIFHPGYLRDYRRYMKHPTKRPPPTAGDYPCAYACVYRGGKIWKQFFTQFPKNQFSASCDRVEVRIGDDNRLIERDGVYDLRASGTPWAITARGPQREDNLTLSVSLSFKRLGTHPPVERAFLSEAMTGAQHQWTVAAPRCEVSGEIKLVSTSSSESSPPDTTIPISGNGYHDHNYGTAPIGAGLSRWIWGRAMFRDRVLTFHHAEPGIVSSPPETHLVEVNDNAVRDLDPQNAEIDWSLRCKPAMMLTYPSSVRFGDALTLTNPRVIDPSPFYLRLAFDAVSRGESARAFCEVAYPHRIGWPILGRMIEMSFDKRPLRC